MKLYAANGQMGSATGETKKHQQNSLPVATTSSSSCKLSSLNPVVLIVLVILIILHSFVLFFVYTKIVKLETLMSRDRGMRDILSFDENGLWKKLVEEKVHEAINKELLNGENKYTTKSINVSLASSSVFFKDETDSGLSVHASGKKTMLEYPSGPARPSSLPKRSLTEKNLLIGTSDGKIPEKGDQSAISSRTKREVHGRRQFRNGGEQAGDELSVQLQRPNGGDKNDDKSWLQLTSYARIPYNAIQEFCAKTRDSCPPGPEGSQGPRGVIGPQGIKGEIGDRGLPGIQGPRGPTGLPGIPGPPGLNGRKGEMGPAGIPGLDGRDGLPGEPGLDGIPGRNGLDGIPGVDGIPGFDGRPGQDGHNGTNGRPGEKGKQGERGPFGPRGIAGPRGRGGKNGAPGIPGVPGINTWKVNGTQVNKILIPPSIAGTKRRQKPIIVNENENVRLRCEAVGEPVPRIEWSREDGMAIATGQWKDGSLSSPLLNLTHIRRDHTGRYRCEAYNGIPPKDFKTFDVEVHFHPYIRVNNWKVGTYNGSTASLECHVEAFPVALTYWEDHRGRILENSTKYRIIRVQDKNFIWKGSMFLQILDITAGDFGDYHCVAKNDLSTTRGLVKVHAIDPTRYVPSTGTVDGLRFGPDPPNYSELFNDLCPPPVLCPTCPEKAPPSRGSLYCLKVEQFGNDTYPGFRNRSLDCELSAVGKPVYHRHTDSDFGSWMRDPNPRDAEDEKRYWTTTPDEPRYLFEYSDKIKYRKNQSTAKYILPHPFEGNSHVVYDSSFFYQRKNSKQIVKYDIRSRTTQTLYVPRLFVNESNYLYNGGKDFIDLTTDENGLWAIYGLRDSNNTVVMKLDASLLKVEYSWNISMSHQKFGEMFITCGVLYGIDSSTKRDTKIRFALDLFKKKILDVNLPFTNPFGKTTMLGYNPRTKEIYSWDDGNQLTYPIKYIDIGYNTPFDDRGNEPNSRKKHLDYETDYFVGDVPSA